MNNYTNNQYNTAAKILVAYLLIGTVAIIASIGLGIANHKKANTIESLENELRDIKLCSLDVVVCEGEEEPKPVQTTQASWYDYKINGVEWSKSHRTVASKEFERGTLLKVTNVENGKSVEVMVNDYGPDASVHPDRELDLSSYAFSLIADKNLGVITVDYQEVGKDEYYQPNN